MTNNTLSENIFIIAGEVSGDIFAAQLMNDLKQHNNYEFHGCGGVHMRKAGLNAIGEDNSLLSSIGLFEAIRFLGRQWALLRKIVPAIKKCQAKKIILVDHEVFCILAAKLIRKTFKDSVKIYFFIPPRVSMWGKKSAPVVAKLCDALFCYMKPDLPIYQKFNSNSFFFGNPLSKKLKTFCPSPYFLKKHNLDPHKRYIALMPGSRKPEVSKLLPVFLEVASRLYKERNIEFLMTIAHKGLQKHIQKLIKKHYLEHQVHCLEENSLEIMNHVDIGIVSAGTITLEAVMMRMYPIITYKISNFTFKTMQKSENLDNSTLVGLPNVFMQERIFPELLQFEVNPQRIYEEVIYALDLEKDFFNYLIEGAYQGIYHHLGDTESITKVAEYINGD